MTHLSSLDQVGPHLKKLRLKTGKSIRTIADLAGVDANSLRYWENNTYPPKLANLMLMLKFYEETASVGREPS